MSQNQVLILCHMNKLPISDTWLFFLVPDKQKTSTLIEIRPEIKSTVSIKTFNQIHFNVPICVVILLKSISKTNIQAGMLQSYGFWKGMASLQAMFHSPHVHDASWPQSTLFYLSQPGAKRTESMARQEMKNQVIRAQYYWWETEAEYVMFSIERASEDQSWSWILAYSVWVLSTAPAGPDAIVLMLRKKETSRGKGQHWLYFPDNPSPDRLSQWASKFYQFALQRMSRSFLLFISSSATPLPVLFQVQWDFRKLNTWCHPGTHLEIPDLHIFSLCSDQVGNILVSAKSLLIFTSAPSSLQTHMTTHLQEAIMNTLTIQCLFSEEQ